MARAMEREALLCRFGHVGRDEILAQHRPGRSQLALGQGRDLVSSEDRPLAQDVRELAGEKDERGLSALVHRGDVWLNQGNSPTGLNPFDQRASRAVGVGAEAARVAGTGGDVRLDDDLSVQGRQGVSRRHVQRRDRGRRKLVEIALIGVERDEVRAVAEPFAADATTPGDEVVDPGRVVPGRADHDPVKGRPIHARVIP
jgi:hypothetical protein